MSNRHKGVAIAINREITMTTIINQLPDLDDRQLDMVSDYIRGLKAARNYLDRYR